ncbi:MAG TPA: PDZ domain-containing protein [Candidatus Cybelea sp.]|nr:PDZ domain-containing protein [Candidatus Cybelea sp.]
MKKVLPGILCALAFLLGAFASAAQSDEPLLLRQPTLSRTDICFVYGDDLWRVSRDGGEAIRLTAGPGIKRGPHYSPDGNWIAFTGEYDGTLNVYVLPATGGTPRRLTFHGGPDTAVGWTPDGKNVLFSSPRETYASGIERLYTVPVEGGFATLVPLPLAYEGSYSPDGSHIAYRPTPQAWGTWSHYRGGTETQLWIANLADSSIVKVPRDDWNDLNPMWIGDTVYYLADKNGPYTLFAYDTKSQKNEQVFENTALPLKSASAGPGAIVYEQFGSLHLYDLASHQGHTVRVHIHADLVQVRPHFEKVAKHVDNAAISPTGVRAVFEAHGEILTAPVKKGDIRNITRSPGVADRDPSWSPDGKWIAYFSDESGEYTLHLSDQSGQGEVKKIDLAKSPTYFYSPTWSPDSKKVAYTDVRSTLWYVDLDKPTPTKIVTGYYDETGFSPTWSPDSRWIAYTSSLPNHMNAVFVYSLETHQSTEITDGMSDARSVAFDKNGKYLYFTASTNVGPTLFGLNMSTDDHTVTRSVYVVVLRKDLPSPFAPESDEEKVEGEKKDADSSKSSDAGGQKDQDKDADKGKDKDVEKKKEPPKVTIDFDNISQRIVAVPIPARNYVDLEPGKEGEFFVAEIPRDGGDNGPTLTLSKFTMEKRKSDEIASGLRNLAISFNGEKMLYQQGDDWFIAATAEHVKPGDGELKLDDMDVWVDPQAEWKQMFHEIWRIERDFLYDAHYHGLNLVAAEKEYSAYLPGIATRDDLNYLFDQMLSEINVGHMFVGGGDIPEVTPVKVGLLGADYSIENGRYRFHRVYNGENWNPRLQAPLTQPGVNVVAGEYLLAVNGRELHASDDVYSLFQETAGRQTLLKVGPNPDGSGSREVTVVPVDNEEQLRNRAWIEDNIRKVDQMTYGKVAYVYLPNTANGGFTNFNRYYFAQIGKQGAVIDERFNTGGQAADYIIEVMQRKIWSYWTPREGGISTTPLGIFGPKAMVTNEFSGSGGDALPWYFHLNGLGPLVGKRTWGGLVGIGGYPPLIDGGYVTAPRFAFFTKEGTWDVENHGVQPDFEIEFDPHAWREGRDPQLEKAVNLVMDDLKKNPPAAPKIPPYPNYSKYSTVH